MLPNRLPVVDETGQLVGIITRDDLLRSLQSVYRYAQQRQLPLHYNFVSDLNQYRDEQLRRSLPTLILHGKNDEVIPINGYSKF